MAIRLISAQRAEDLLDDIVELLAPPRDDPFERDLVVVPNVGIRDWLVARLAERLGATGDDDGIVANVEFAFPGRLAAALDAGHTGSDPWSIDRLVWPILRRLEGGDPEVPGYAGTLNRWAFARHVADLFDHYAVHRPEMLLRWLDGDNDGGGSELAAEHHWQPALWRAVRSDLGEASPAERATVDAAHGSQLPRRVALFGIGALTPSQVTALHTLGAQHDLLVLALLPAPGPLLDADDATDAATRFDNGLLRAWGQASLETAGLLGTLHVETTLRQPSAPNQPTLLEHLQFAVANDQAPSREAPITDGDLPPTGDGSVQVHACHGATRQVEALRDSLLHLFEQDPDLTPRDVLVLCPDLDRFAPLIQPILGSTSDGRVLRVLVADRAITTQSPVNSALEALLRTASGRVTRTDVQSLLAHPPIRDALRLDQEALELLDRWTEQLDLSWGIDGTHRTRWGYRPGLADGTWRDGVDRLAAGILLSSPTPRLVGDDLVPFDDIGDRDLATIGAIGDAVDRLTALVQKLGRPNHVDAWLGLLEHLCATWLSVPHQARWQLEEIEELVTDLRDEVAEHDDLQLTGAEFCTMVVTRLGVLRGRTRLDTGAVTVASPTPLQGVPAAVVAILGFDASALGVSGPDGDDLVARLPQPGESDAAAERSRTLLDAVLAARRHLVITYDGHDPTNNQPVPPAVPLAEFLDQVRDTLHEVPDGERGDLPVLVHHTRRLDHPQNLGVGDDGVRRLHPEGPWTHDPAATRARDALDGDGHAPVDFTPLPPCPDVPATFDDLANDLSKPARALLRGSLGVRLPAFAEVSDERLELWPDSLRYSGLGRDAIEALVAGQWLDEWMDARAAGGGLPPAELGRAALEAVASEIQEMTGLFDGDPGAGGVEFVDLGSSGRSLSGPIRVHGNVILELAFVRPHPHRRLHPWLRLAALTLHDPSRPWEALLVCRGKTADKPPEETRFRLVGDTNAERHERAEQVLDTLADLRRRSLRAPVPLFRRLSWTFPGAAVTDAGKLDPAKDLERDLGDRWTRQCHPDGLTIEDLEAEPSTPLEQGLSQHASRAGRYARTLTDCWHLTTDSGNAA